MAAWLRQLRLITPPDLFQMVPNEKWHRPEEYQLKILPPKILTLCW